MSREYIKYILFAIGLFLIHYLFIEIIHSEKFIYIMFVIWIGSIIIILAELFEPSEDMKWAIYAAIAFIISFSFPFTGIGLTKETQTYTIQIKDFSGDYYIKEYEIPKNSNFYLGSTGRYGGNTMLRYKTYPFAGKILEHNVQSYKIINIE